MATLSQKIECEANARKVLTDAGLPEPDEVEYGCGCIRFFFHESKTVLVIDIDDRSATSSSSAQPPA
jgi:hypothetical protein